MKIEFHAGFDDMPPAFRDMLDAAGALDLFNTRAWFKLLARHGRYTDEEFGVYVAWDDDGAPLLVMPVARIHRAGRLLCSRILASIAHLENFAPVCIQFRDGATGRQALMKRFFSRVRWDGESGPRFDLVRLCPFEINSEYGVMVYRAVRGAGYWIQAYANSFNRFEIVEGMSHEDYLAKFTSKERYNIRSRQRGLEKKSDFDFELIDTEEGLTPVIEEYIKVSMASWKDPTSMINDWIFDLMVLAARHDMLRLGILRLDGVAVAVQFWLVSAGVAHSVHIAYDEEYKRRHVGVVLTNLMIGIVLDRDHAKEMSYGFGNEPYKSTWMRDSRFFCGYAGFNSRSFRGNLQGVLHIIGRPAKKLVLRLLGRAPEEDIDPEISK